MQRDSVNDHRTRRNHRDCDDARTDDADGDAFPETFAEGRRDGQAVGINAFALAERHDSGCHEDDDAFKDLSDDQARRVERIFVKMEKLDDPRRHGDVEQLLEAHEDRNVREKTPSRANAVGADEDASGEIAQERVHGLRDSQGYDALLYVKRRCAVSICRQRQRRLHDRPGPWLAGRPPRLGRRDRSNSEAACGPSPSICAAAAHRQMLEARTPWSATRKTFANSSTGLGIAPAIVAGHSMGATVALRLAVDAPQSVRALVLIAPVPASGGGYSPKGEAYLRATAGDPVEVKAWLARTFAAEPDEATLAPLCAAAASHCARYGTGVVRVVGACRFCRGNANDSHARSSWSRRRRMRRSRSSSASPHCFPTRDSSFSRACAHYVILERPGAIAELMREVCRQ